MDDRDCIKGRYVGPHAHLKDRTALIQLGRDKVLAQFDDVGAKLGDTRLGFGWHEFERTDFEMTNLRTGRNVV